MQQGQVQRRKSGHLWVRPNITEIFIPNFAVVAAPLFDLTRKGQPNMVEWGDAQEKAYQTIKFHLTNEPILSPRSRENVLLENRRVEQRNWCSPNAET